MWLNMGQFKTLKQVEREHIRFAIIQANSNVSQAAKLLEISRATLYRKIRSLEIVVVRTALKTPKVSF